MGGAKDWLRPGYGNDVARWKDVEVEGGRVVNVDWSEIGLTGTIPATIGELDTLFYPNLGHNFIRGHSASEIGNLTSIEALSLSVNSLESFLPPSIRNLTSLSELRLDNNCFTALPSTLDNIINLQILDLSFNNIDIDVPERTLGIDSMALLGFPYEEDEVLPYLRVYHTFSHDDFRDDDY